MTDLRSQTLEALRHYAVRYQESALHFAAWMELPTSDGVALGEILWAETEGEPMTGTRLARRIGMTSGAANALVNRLEERGLIMRSRESADRRVVTLRVTELTRERSSAFLGSRAAELDEAIGSYDDDTLTVVRDFLFRFAAVLPQDDTAPSKH
ncbi:MULTISPECIES: MarR family winged helix-turn-helix transcriptional regulator [Curtobacterium]|uniref:MarR family transcriptional regulator n=1 Tax=Curtobacterium poinsettiae TaxID=159612 RepID=A0ABT3S5E3_9MICO|nr:MULTISPECIES: MarR family transcriptional regulator [Curtobacterium]MBT1610048.1 MarR family transcriptional regulator [Curtobacterium flaccumfaciens pv. poinsettiae]MBT1619394.1 MarR family transcriptional regulator [Curtobacterium flaccumfaciens pv. poinsettiae]MCS6564354.1 MarR family transcriptional regulator [Curtobacterium flaccumfaciens pv. flaccumfaciens]MCS6577926.1 MarR family transcriptional regulator [Curtobacterium flaccumfaciens]MCX2850048.1 MarR family transcriptional regulat